MAGSNADLPDPVSFRTGECGKGASFGPRRQPWCKISYTVTGVIEADVEGQQFLCPPHYATWIPADAQHSCRTPQGVKFASIHIRRDLCEGMPNVACTLALSPLIKAILADFASRKVSAPSSAADIRLALVLVDQLRMAPRRESYLPICDDEVVQPITDALRQDPRSRRSLAEWARMIGTTERTLSRRFQSSLGISFNEWRQRMKLVASLSMLERGQTVGEIAKDLGYRSPSAFIVMFRRQTGASPTHLAQVHSLTD